MKAVRIKSWEQMEQEFGTDTEGDIQVCPYFLSNMKYLCNTTVLIDNKNVLLESPNWGISHNAIAEYYSIEEYPEYYI